MARTKFYVQFKAVYGTSSWDLDTLKEIKAMKLTQNRSGESGDITVEFEIDIPEEVLLPKVKVAINTLGAAITNLQQTERDLR